MLSVICWKWWDPQYRWNSLYHHDAEHVNKLNSMLKRHLHLDYEFFCFADTPDGLDSDITVVPLGDELAEHGGCYRRLRMYKRDMLDIVGPRFVSLDIDVVIVDDVTPLFERTEPFVAWKDVLPRRQAFNSSMVLMDTGVHHHVWAEFDIEIAEGIKRNPEGKFIGTDQAWVFYKLGPDVPVWSRVDGVVSFGWHCVEKRREGTYSGSLPADARIVIFHGPYDPSMDEIREEHPWIEEHWR